VIERLIEAVRRRADAGDALWHRAERTSIAFESGRVKACGVSEETGVNLRVRRGGRAGIAGTTAGDVEDLVTRALASAELGETVPLEFPPPASAPSVLTHAAAAADASLERLREIGTELVSRTSRDGCQVNVSIEREVGRTAVANTAGAAAAYDSTAVAVSVDLARFAGDDVLFVSDHYSGTDLPTTADLDALVESIALRFVPALTIVAPPDGALPVVFSPSGLSAILLPLEQALSGKGVLQGVSPLGAKLGEKVLDERFSITDDPLLPGRPGSRPVDDEGTPSRRLPLIERGVVRAFVYDLETAARAGTRSTGHGSRGTFGKPHIGYSNWVVGDPPPAGSATRGPLGGGLLGQIADGLLIEDLIGVGQGNVIGGAFSHPVALAYRVQGGAITGRVKDAAVAGNVYELLTRIGGFGSDGRWLGSGWAASLLLDGVAVARR
jgi:PmbA protein